MAKWWFHTFSVHYVIPYLRSRAEKGWWCKLQDKNARSKITVAGILAKGTLCIQKRGSSEPLNPSTACQHKGVAQEENVGYSRVIIIHYCSLGPCVHWRPIFTHFNPKFTKNIRVSLLILFMINNIFIILGSVYQAFRTDWQVLTGAFHEYCRLEWTLSCYILLIYKTPSAHNITSVKHICLKLIRLRDKCFRSRLCCYFQKIHVKILTYIHYWCAVNTLYFPSFYANYP